MTPLLIIRHMYIHNYDYFNTQTESLYIIQFTLLANHRFIFVIGCNIVKFTIFLIFLNEVTNSLC